MEFLMSCITSLLFTESLTNRFALPCDDAVLDDILEQYTEQHLQRGASHEFRQLILLVTGLNIEDFDVVRTPDEAKALYSSARIFVVAIHFID